MRSTSPLSLLLTCGILALAACGDDSDSNSAPADQGMMQTPDQGMMPTPDVGTADMGATGDAAPERMPEGEGDLWRLQISLVAYMRSGLSAAR